MKNKINDILEGLNRAHNTGYKVMEDGLSEIRMGHIAIYPEISEDVGKYVENIKSAVNNVDLADVFDRIYNNGLSSMRIMEITDEIDDDYEMIRVLAKDLEKYIKALKNECLLLLYTE